MDTDFPLSERVEVLFSWGELQGLNVTYTAIADATGESWTNFRKIRKGENANPGLRTMEALARYFGVKLDYFQCESEAECLAYLNGITENSVLSRAKMRAHSLSPEALVTLQNMIDQVVDYMQKAEGKAVQEGSEE